MLGKYFYPKAIKIAAVFAVAFIFFCWQVLVFLHQSQASEDAVALASRRSGLKIADSDLPAKNIIPLEPVATVKALFVGDIMLDRSVEALAKKTSWSNIFLNTPDFFSGHDLVVGNLEGPLVKNPPDFGPGSLRFAFNSQAADVLNKTGFNFFSLANNHILNMGADGFKQTKEFLDSQGIGYAGEAYGCLVTDAKAQGPFVFYAINQTFSTDCSAKEIEDTIKKIRADYPDKFLVVLVHWGIEYKTVNSTAQKNLAHKMIDAGADLIIGSHPHVVENIEQYQGKLIFYSLGNFVFDQYFSTATQEGLGVGLEIFDDKKVFRLLAFDLAKSQPKLMAEEKAQKLLAGLASRSSAELKDGIKSGIIEIVNLKSQASNLPPSP